VAATRTVFEDWAKDIGPELVARAQEAIRGTRQP
jgi:hypothetical protein